jgi:energy-dependent translational throttle protein EttA
LRQEKKDQSAAAKAVSAELEWIRSNPKAKSTKSKARLKRYDELLLAAAPAEVRNAGQIYIPPGPRLGDVVVDFHNVRKSFGHNKLLIDDLSFSLPPNAILGVVGPNGAGTFEYWRAEIEWSSRLVRVCAHSLGSWWDRFAQASLH